MLANRFKGNVFIKNILIISSGAGLAQLLMLIASPLFTRLYSQSDFGIFATFMAISAIILPLSNGKLDSAIILPKNLYESKRILDIASSYTCVFCITLLLILSIIQIINVNFFTIPYISDFGNYLLLISVFILINGLYLNSSFYSNRALKYKHIAKSKILISTSTILVSIVLGYFTQDVNGLIIGSVLGYLIGLLFLYLTVSRFKIKYKTLNFSTPLLYKYRDFPKYNSTSSSLNAISIHLPFMLFLASYGVELAGLFALTVRVINAPLIFLSTSISQVLISHTAQLFRDRKNVLLFVYKVFFGLSLISVIPLFIITIWGERLFVIVFGSAWGEAGVFSQILVFGLLFRFVVSTISCTLNSANRSDLLAFWKTTSLILTTIVLGAFSVYADSETFLYACLLLDVFLYTFYLMVIYIGIKKPAI